MNTIQTHPETLLVCRDGELDDEYYDAVYAWKRQEALKQAGRDVLHFSLVSVPKTLGKGIVYLINSIPEPEA